VDTRAIVPTMSNSPLLEMVRYNNWANQQMIAHCRELPPEVLEHSIPGVFGTIPSTLAHLIGTEAYFYAGVTGAAPENAPARGESLPLDELAEFQSRVAALWEAFAENPGDVHRPMAQGRAGVRPPVIAAVTQLICHGSEHRAQVETLLGSLGLPPPEFNPWVYTLRTA